VACPSGSTPLSGGLAGYRARLLVIRSRPQGSAWQFKILNPDGAGRGSVRVMVVCARVPALTVFRTLESGNSKARLSCPAGYAATTTGWDFIPPSDAFEGFLGWVIRRIDPGGVVSADDLSAESHSTGGPLHLYGRCVRANLRAVTTSAELRTGDRSVHRSCPLGTRAVGTGFSTVGDRFLNGMAVTSARAARWTLFNRGPGRARVKLTLVCMG
jgi:hypothetical protein